MNINQFQSHQVVMDGWPILVAFALYIVAFGIVAITMTSGILAV